ncbi:Na-translocating system protein MpsC family protein [Wukongibacter baidiensis]|uniref:Na-translocating system protein MpsC family protein n=1 Tax=Wukongibacter baidiensis TaxID=1723361 RepID=UPI003D7F262F
MHPVKLEGLLYNLKVLYVEDEEFTRNELSRFLKRRVGKLYVSQNGEEGIEIFQDQRPDLVITDLKMPIMDGLEMTRVIRNMGSNCPVIIITALSDSETIIKAVDIGIVKYIIKPVNTKELLLTIEDLASNVLKSKFKGTEVNNSYFISKDEKHKIEKKIKSEIAHFIKSYTGKGPKDVQVFIRGNEIEVKAVGVLTVFQKNLIANNRNFSLVNYNRRLLYIENCGVLEEKTGEILGFKPRIINAEPDSAKNMDRITFSLN